MKSKTLRILEDLNKDGFSQSSIDELLTNSEKSYFYDIKSFYSEAIENNKLTDRINSINKGSYSKFSKYKQYEISHDELLNEPLTFENLPLIKLYLSKNILEIAKAYLGNEIKIRNPLAWIHPWSKARQEIRSQKWHRDQEDTKMLKVFILFSDVNEKNGPTQYVKSTNFSGRYKNIAPNMTWLNTHWSKKNSFINRCYNFIRNKIPFNYPIPKSKIVKATGKVGSIFFIDTNGLHKGGLVEEGMRLMTHCNFLKKSAPMLKKGMPLEKLNSDEKLYSFDYNSMTFKSFDPDSQKILT